MRRLLLLAAATLVVASASAQLPASKVQSKKVNTTLPAATFKHYQEAGAKNVGQPTMVARRAFEKPITVTPAMKSSMKGITKFSNRAAAPALAPSVQEKYEAYGINVSTNKPESWEMLARIANNEDGTTANILTNVIPSPFDFDVDVEYTFDGTEITIEPQLVASGSASDDTMLYIFIESATSSTGTITLTVDDTGAITGSYSILYGAYSSEEYTEDNYLGYYDYFRSIKYNIPGMTLAPTVSFEPTNLVLFASLGLNGYSYNNNLAMTSAFAPVNFHNLTADPATAWNWSVEQTDLLEEDEEAAETTITGDTQDFIISTKGYTVYHNPKLIGFNKEKESDPYIFGTGKYKTEEGTDRYTDTYIYTYNTEDDFLLNEETNAIITRQDPDGDLTFYTNWGTNDKAPNPMSKIYIYHDQPATPLYLTGVTIPLVASSYEDDFNLHIRIVKCTDNINGRPELGEVIAEGDATIENVNQDFDSGLTAIEFRELYMEDEIGMSTALDYLFIDSPFMIIIDDWDNGTFSGVMGSQDVPLDNALTSTWFEMLGEEGSMYSYTSWKTSLFVGLLGVDNGWLYTEDDTDINLTAEGGEATLHISPKYYADGDDGPETALWLDENILDNEVPEWLEISYTNPTGSGDDLDSDFDLTIVAEPLPAGVTSRSAKVVLMQWGAQLTLNITQIGDEGPGEFQPIPFDGTDGKYILVNPASNKSWGAANDWGTRASLVEHPEYVTLLQQEDGTYFMESQVSNGGTSYYFGGDYMDGQPVALTITATQILGYSDEAETQPVYGYTIANGDNFFGYDGTSTILGKNLPADSENALWIIASEAEAIAALANASAEDPSDATFLIKNPNFGRNNRNAEAWTVSDDCTNKNLCGGDDTNRCAESYHSVFTISQLLENVPNGIYAVQAQGFYRQDGEDNDNLPVFFANDETEVFPLKTGTENSMAEASVSFKNGLYYGEPIYVEVKDGKLNIGVKLENNTNLWCIWDNFSLKYYGADADLNEVKNAAIIAQLEDLIEKAEELQDQVEVDAVKTALAEAIKAAEDVSSASSEEDIKAAVEALNTAVDAAEASVIAKNVLPAMKNLVDATNVYTEEALNTYYTQWNDKYQAGTLTKGEASALQNPDLVTGWHAAITVDNFLLSAWDTNPDFDNAPYYINSWSVEGDTDGSNFRVPFFEYWTGDDASLGAKTLTATMSGLEAGEYEVKALVRVRTKNNTGSYTPGEGITLQVNDGEAVDVAKGDKKYELAADNNFFVGEFAAKGNVEGDLNIKFNVAAENNVSWLSFKNVWYTRLGVINGISSLNDNAAQQNVIYNLNGQQVEKAQKGLYIKNGKKVVVK